MRRVIARVAASALGAAGLWLGGSLAQAQSPVPAGWEGCSQEVARFCPKASSSNEIFQCIEGREKLGKKKSGLSKGCYETHERFESEAHEKQEHESGAEKSEEHEHSHQESDETR